MLDYSRKVTNIHCLKSMCNHSAEWQSLTPEKTRSLGANIWHCPHSFQSSACAITISDKWTLLDAAVTATATTKRDSRCAVKEKLIQINTNALTVSSLFGFKTLLPFFSKSWPQGTKKGIELALKLCSENGECRESNQSLPFYLRQSNVSIHPLHDCHLVATVSSCR